jgi:hypothetical protein
MVTTAQARGLAFGAAILTLFGLAWAMAALLNYRAHPHWAVILALWIAASLIAAAVFRMICPGGTAAADPNRAAAEGKRAGMWFGIIFGLEGALIAGAAILLSANGLQNWIPVAAAAIVGIHFLPLARLFRVPLYYFTGIVSVIAAAASFAVHDPAVRVFWLGINMATILWITATVALVQARPARG